MEGICWTQGTGDEGTPVAAPGTSIDGVVAGAGCPSDAGSCHHASVGAGVASGQYGVTHGGCGGFSGTGTGTTGSNCSTLAAVSGSTLLSEDQAPTTAS